MSPIKVPIAGQASSAFPKDAPVKIPFLQPPPGLESMEDLPVLKLAAALPEQAGRVEPEIREITLVKPPGGKLGIAVVPIPVSNLSGIYVKAVEPGSAIDAHNRTCAEDEMVSPGDCIVRVGDTILNAVQMMEDLSKGDEIKVTIMRQVSLKHDAYSFPFASDNSVPLKLHPFLSEAPTEPPSSPALTSGASDNSFFSQPWDSFIQLPTPAKTPTAYSSQSSQHSHGTMTPPPGLAEPLSPKVVENTTTRSSNKIKSGNSNAKGGKLTTLMLRQLPYSLTRERLAALLDAEGFAGLYDFIYMPVNLQTKKSFTYAFVNMVTPSAAAACRDKLNAWSSVPGCGCVASWADSEQGLAANVARFRNSPVMHERVDDACKPALYKDGVRVPFPPPTKALKAPPMRKRIESAEAFQSKTPVVTPPSMVMCPMPSDDSEYGHGKSMRTTSLCSSASTSFGSDYMASEYGDLPMLD